MRKKLILMITCMMLSLLAVAQTYTVSWAEVNKKATDYYKNKDYKKALPLYQQAAEGGYSLAQCNLGFMYEKGYGVEKDLEKAVEWYRKSAEQGYRLAQCNLAYMYETGSGIGQDYLKASEWYEKAARQGLNRAQYNLGRLYMNGFGVAKDYKKAMDWFMKAADQNYHHAECNIGYMYHNGLGVEKSYTKAVEWYQKAADGGNETAKNNLALIKQEEGEQKKPTELAEQKKPTEQTEQKKPTEQVVQKKPTEQVVQKKPTEQYQTDRESVDQSIPSLGRVNRNTFAVIIANEDYQQETNVEYAKNDGEVFKDYCHKTLGLPEKNVHYLPNATLARLYGELDWLQQICEAYSGDASVIFYYAGHGVPNESNGSAYLLPTDGSSRLLRTCLSINELFETLGKLPAKKVTVLMDACFSGAKRNGDMLASARGVAIKAKPAAIKGNLVVFSAAQGDQTAYKYEEARHGLFTYFLLKKLKESKGDVTLGELSSFIQDQVKRFSIVENGKIQTPSVQVSDNLRSNWQTQRFD